MTAKVITIAVRKGGVGKTTTAHELSSRLAELGNKVLAIDLDAQRNLTRISGAQLDDDLPSIKDVLCGEYPFEACVQRPENVKYAIAVSGRSMEEAEKTFSRWDDVYRLDTILEGEQVKENYDYIIIDTPPKLAIETDMALTASNYVVIPSELSRNCVDGIADLFERIQSIRHPKKGTNHGLKILGILMIKFKKNQNLDKEIKVGLENVVDVMETKVFETFIREAVAIKGSQMINTSIFDYDPKAKPAIDYVDFTNELLETIKEMN